MRYNRSILIVLIILALSSCIQGAFAGAPPYYDRPTFFIPRDFTPYVNQSEENCTVTDAYPPIQTQPSVLTIPPDMSDSAPDISDSPPPFFPDLSQDYALRNMSCNKTNDRFIAIMWYFNKWETFKEQRERLFTYLSQHGSMSNVTLTFAEARSVLDNTTSGKLTIRHINVIKYDSMNTSGYFAIFNSGYFPGPNYFIAYYGIIGSSDVDDYLPNLESFLATGYSDDQFNPVVPMATPTIPVPTVIPFGAVAIVVMIRKIRGNH
ncbi:hypothetical protein [Methanoregula formicica]|uniref:Uncharacterized protein n=1 Tax=Methanoregula formicica (strain DSM 22288 / NBRC 105244 / SMSP) TaxID=593750 RepID=L0H9G3_METFS|nr:hypothetical protein [Methanoregula formicica]AGB01382.1 hypothetical protein Metfor_0304 [Methanoregula formicica SMSP]